MARYSDYVSALSDAELHRELEFQTRVANDTLIPAHCVRANDARMEGWRREAIAAANGQAPGLFRTV